jgi:hypothetical protein
MHVPLPGEMHGYQAILLQIIPEVVGCLFYHLINELKLTPLPPIPDDPMIQARRDEYERKTANEARMQWIDEHPDAEEQPPFLPPPTQQEEDDLKEEVREREAILQQWKERQEQVGCVEWFYDKTEMNTMNRIFYLRIMPGRCARISRPGRLVLDLATGLYTGDEGDVGKQ